jgi:hypothetical protein
MKRSFRLSIVLMAFLLAAGAIAGPGQHSAHACPSCKNANETDSRRPKAYMYSILFMLAMPATVFTGFGIAFYRMSRREAQLPQELTESSGEA